MDVQQLFQTWNKQTGQPVAEFEAEYKNIMEEYKKTFPDDSNEIRERRALERIRAYNSKSFKGNSAKNHEIILFSMGKVYDKFVKDRNNSKTKGFTDSNDKPLFHTNNFKNGNPIPEAGTPDSDGKTGFGMFKPIGADNWIIGNIWLEGRKICETQLSVLIPLKITGTVNKEGTAFNMTNSSIVTIDKEAKQIDFKKMSEAMLAENFVPFNELSVLENSFSYPHGIIITSGIVTNISMTKVDIKSNLIELMAKSNSIEDLMSIGTENVRLQNFWVPKSIPLNIGIGSEVMVMFDMKPGQDKKTGESKTNCNVHCIYVITNTAPKETTANIMDLIEDKPVNNEAWRG